MAKEKRAQRAKPPKRTSAAPHMRHVGSRFGMLWVDCGGVTLCIFAGSTASFAGKMLAIRVVYTCILTSDSNRVNAVAEKIEIARAGFCQEIAGAAAFAPI